MNFASNIEKIGACWVNGNLVDPLEASISAVDHAIVVGDGVFETLKVSHGVPFAVSRHIKRLVFSAQGLGMSLPNENLVRKAIDDILDKDPTAERLRVTWSSGPGPLSSFRGDGGGTLSVASSPGTNWPASEKVQLSEWTRNENGPLTGLKTTSYAENVKALHSAREVGCSEAVFLNTSGWLCEGTGTNIFFVIGGKLVTPDLSSGCLAGITRELVIEIAEVKECEISLSEASGASEAFLTSSTRDISPISNLGEIVLPEVPGPVTLQVSEKFADLVASNPDP
jgi:branched-chain amino acid aminotransferase